MQRNIKYVSLAFKPCGETTKLMVMLKQKDGVTASGKTVCRSKTAKT
jgi:hypothetical protein